MGERGRERWEELGEKGKVGEVERERWGRGGGGGRGRGD